MRQAASAESGLTRRQPYPVAGPAGGDAGSIGPRMLESVTLTERVAGDRADRVRLDTGLA